MDIRTASRVAGAASLIAESLAIAIPIEITGAVGQVLVGLRDPDGIVIRFYSPARGTH